MMIFTHIIIILIMLYSPVAHAGICGAWGTSGNNPWFVTSSAEGTPSTANSDVASCVAVATYGDTINIPAGTSTWTTQINITKNITINGAGSSVTVLTDGLSSPASFFSFIPDEQSRSNIAQGGSGVFEIKNIGFTGTRVTNIFPVTISSTNTPVSYRIKIHDCTFISMHRAVNIYGYISGVFYNNYLIGSNAAYPQGAGYLGWENDARVFAGSNGWYIEDNIFDFDGKTGLIFGAANAGYSGVIMRYNTATGTMAPGGNFWEIHGNQDSGVYGPQSSEVYGNSITGATTGSAAVIRGGKNLVFNNVITNTYVTLWEEYSDLLTSQNYPTNKCPENQGVERQNCSDCICQKVHSTYVWNTRLNTITGNNIDAYVTMDYENRGEEIVNNPLELVEDIEFFNYESSFDGTTGVGCGTLANRPATCTAGVGYWATDQKCDDLSGMVGANPSTPISGKLYKCVSTNTWSTDDDGITYTPYTYPHPLRVQKFTGNIMIGGAGLFN